MAESETEAEDRTLDASARKLQQAREQGDVPVSREGPAAGVHLAALVAVLLTAGVTASRVGDILMPMIDQPDELLNVTSDGWQQAGFAVLKAVGIAVAPFFILLMAGAMLPYVLQGSITIAPERLGFKASHLSPAEGLKRLFSTRSLFEFGKSLVKVAVIAITCFLVARPLYQQSVGLVGADVALLPRLLQEGVTKILLAATLCAVVIAGIDIPYQHLTFHRRMRMSRQEMKEEMRSIEGDPHIKARLKRLRRQRARRRMMQDVPKATVVIANPTHFAVALRYERGKDAAPIVVAKGVDLIAIRIKKVAAESGVPVMESPPLARALHGSVEIGEMIPHEHFEAVAKIIGIVWARRRK
ncbi:MAG: flagellar biosynthesis protein FlhB [Rhodospirillales bacterium 20-64-7]|nr:MAG: flagellar biosynthesis protein FlhB [Rhodospirillales bacterium 20-64-7]HQT77236.1 flagellar biosynthesis protein FlhB [Rhodopila sp.]